MLRGVAVPLEIKCKEREKTALLSLFFSVAVPVWFLEQQRGLENPVRNGLNCCQPHSEGADGGLTKITVMETERVKALIKE